MAVVTVKSTPITNRDSSPTVLTSPAQGAHRPMYNAFGRCAITNGDSIGSKYILCEIPSNARVISMRIYSGGAGAGSAANIGLYRNTADGGAVLDADLFCSAVSLASSFNNADQAHESAQYSAPKRDMPLWEAVGLSEDPHTTFDLIAVLTGAAAADTNICVNLDYVQ